MISVNDKPIELKPMLWSDHMTVSVHVGVAGESREEKLDAGGGLGAVSTWAD